MLEAGWSTVYRRQFTKLFTTKEKNKNKKKCCFSSVFSVCFLHLLSSEYINGNLLISPIKNIGKMQPATTTATTKGKNRKEGKCSFNSKDGK